MTRLASTAKAGFYPTPPRVTEWIAQCVAPLTNGAGRLLDPCCGQGIAAQSCARAWNLDAYGIELDAQRAAASQKILKHVIAGDYQSARAPHGSFQVLYLNPPYDYAPGEAKRLEYQFLRDTIKWLAPGGLLVYLIPQYRVDERMARYLTGWFADLNAFKFPEPEYAAFKQVVIFGVLKARGEMDDARADAFLDACQRDLPELPHAAPLYTIPSADTSARFYFRGSAIDPAEALREAHAVGVASTNEWSTLLTPADHQMQSFQPLVPLKKGHLASLIAAGFMQNLRLTKGATTLLVKGYTVKSQVTIQEEKVERVRDVFRTEVVTLDLGTGDITRISDPADFAKFVELWRDVLTQHVQDTFKPLYQFDLKAEGKNVNRVLDGLSKNRQVAGRKETGLFPAQKHTAAAIRKRLQDSNYALCIGEPGVGKTTIAPAVAELLRERDGDPRPVLVLCPPHLVVKWKREIEEIVPGAQAFILERLNDVERFIAHTRANPGLPLYAIISREMAKLGSGWRPAYLIRKMHRRGEFIENKKKVTRVYTETRFACPQCGRVIKNDDDFDVLDESYFTQRKRQCAECHAPLFQMSVRGNARPRYPLADYIARKHRGFFKLFIADEAHQMKGQSTDQGYALGALIRACDKTLALTGTIYGGRSTSLFYLLHRLSYQVRQEFAWSDGQRWVERFGVLERTTPRPDADNGFGTYSGKRRVETRVKEMPGVSPELVVRLLDSAIFLGLADLGFPLPGYAEVAHEIALDADVQKAYAAMELRAKSEIRAAMQKGDKTVGPRFAQALLGYPNACFRAEAIRNAGAEIVASAPAFDATRVFAKEKWLLDFAQAQKALNRKVIVFCRQTGTRDITPRLRDLLVTAGLRVEILRASVDTRKREEWLMSKAAQLDALITNPRIVDTGLDLVQFQNIVWYEPEMSLYVLMQATKRIYRVGQVADVEIHFPVYTHTVEHRAVGLAGQKWAAAQLLYGDSVEGALAQAGDQTDNLLATLTRDLVANARVDDLHKYFKQASKTPAARRIAPPVTPAPPPVAIPTVVIATPTPAQTQVQLALF